MVDRFPGYWNADAIKLDRIVYQPQPDTTVRLVNLQAGQLDMVERLGPTDVATVKKNPKLRLISQPALAYYSMSINLAADSPLKDPRVRAALEAAIDRGVLNQVVFDGQFIPSNQFEAPGSRYWDADHPVPPRDLAQGEGAAEGGRAGASGVHAADRQQPGGAAGRSGGAVDGGEAGFDIKLQAAEANALVAAGRAGNYQATIVIWSGRPDPDGNVAIWLACDGFLNWGKYCNPKFDDLLARARGVTDVAQRQALYRQLVDVYLADRPHIVLYHAKWLWALSDKVSGFTPTPDGLIRPQGMTHRTMTTRIDGERLLGDLYALRKIGEYKTGVHRPTYSPEDVQSRHWLAARMTEAGLEPEIDGIGNVIGRAPGDGAKLLLGSHVETQPHAGWLDGALGVIYGLEVARTLGRRHRRRGLGG